MAAAPRIAAHRGGAALWPENSLAAFAGALALGIDLLELDVLEVLNATEGGCPREWFEDMDEDRSNATHELLALDRIERAEDYRRRGVPCLSAEPDPLGERPRRDTVGRVASIAGAC